MGREMIINGVDTNRFAKIALLVMISSVLLAIVIAISVVGKVSNDLIVVTESGTCILTTSYDSDGNQTVNVRMVDNDYVKRLELQIFFGTLCAAVVLNGLSLLIISRFIIGPMVKKVMTEQKAFRKDNLTGLCRRDVLDERRDWYNKDYDSIGVLYVDVNNLKIINDEYGHTAGDELIKKVAVAISSLRLVYSSIDHYRVGGDEFVIIAMDMGEESFRNIGRDLTEKFRNIVLSKAPNFRVSVAVGYAYSNVDINIESLIQQADKDMYKNKISMKKELNQTE